MNEQMIDILLAHYGISRDKSDLIPFDKMVYRETKNAETHLNIMNELEEGLEKTWRKELYQRSTERANKWQQYSSS